MQQFDSIAEVRAWVQACRQLGERVALVPTMGNLHAGHIKLVTEARQRAERVVVSIFVNPMQFGPNEDFDRYPRTLAEDSRQLVEAGADALFTPSVAEVYPHGHDLVTKIEVPQVSAGMCGDARPGHFAGVATVVAKLFNMVQPDVALFGCKDYQQLQVIRRMVSDLCFPIGIIGVPTVREADGLAMSSRNGYLSPEERTQASMLYQVLSETQASIAAGSRDFVALEQAANARLAGAGFEPEYVNIRDASSLALPSADSLELVILAAARLGKTRLIDNIGLSLRQSV